MCFAGPGAYYYCCSTSTAKRLFRVSMIVVTASSFLIDDGKIGRPAHQCRALLSPISCRTGSNCLRVALHGGEATAVSIYDII